MKIAIASGKGGTGKTTVATNLAYVAGRTKCRVAYLDCDVEEPNGHLFLQPEITDRIPVGKPVPEVDAGSCLQCGECGRICQYSAIVLVGNQVLVYPELCHGCGGCTLVCSPNAITEVTQELGMVEIGRTGPIQFAQGVLHIGQPMSPPVIQAVKATDFQVDLTIIDAPPGTSCPVIEAVRDTDFILLVTEPTPFGFNDLKLAIKMVRMLNIPMGVVINRAGCDGADTRAYCDSMQIPILLEIPDDREIAVAYSQGRMAAESLPQYAVIFSALLESVQNHGKQLSRRD